VKEITSSLPECTGSEFHNLFPETVIDCASRTDLVLLIRIGK